MDTFPKQWEWFQATEGKNTFLLQQVAGKYKKYQRAGRSLLQKRYLKDGEEYVLTQQEELLPTTITPIHRYYIMDEPQQVSPQDTTSNKEISTESLNIDKYQQGSKKKLADAILRGTAVAVSDGSFSETMGTGTASWIISTADKANCVTAGAISPGEPQIQSSYRTEILGVLGVLEELLNICTEWQIKSGK